MYLLLLYLVIDAGQKNLSIKELEDLLSVITDNVTQNKTLELFCCRLRKFIQEFERIPRLPEDRTYFDTIYFDDLMYLIDNCRKITIVESFEPDEFETGPSSIFDEFKNSAILAAEIQKIITRKYLPIINKRLDE